MSLDPTWQRLKTQVLDVGLASHSGLCVGLSQGQLRIKDPVHDLHPEPTVPESQLRLDPSCWEACPGKGLPYPALNKFVFGHLPENWLTGTVQAAFTGHATNERVRREGASGGVITQTLLHLLATRRITGAVVLRLGGRLPYLAEPVIARTPEDILASSQSVYTETPVLTILDQVAREPGPLAFVGLPDQVAAIRMLQRVSHPAVRAIRYVIGPYTGTVLKLQALASYLRAHGVADLSAVASVRYRAGEWPGYLEVRLKDGRVLRAHKFYYNYLIPFFSTLRSSLLAVDFTNELTDISVGDAWAPAYEKQRGGWSVVLGRTAQGVALLKDLQSQNLVSLTPISLAQVVDMHSHMLDFKKRGSFIRISWRRKKGLPAPDFGYEPANIPPSRVRVEYVISGLFALCQTGFARRLVEYLPLAILGPAFNVLRKSWKAVSKGGKRRGLTSTTFVLTHIPDETRDER